MLSLAKMLLLLLLLLQLLAASEQQLEQLELPILVVGMSRCGTSSLAAYFACDGHTSLRVTHHLCAFGHAPRLADYVAARVHANLAAQRAPLADCDAFDVYAELGAAKPGFCFFAQAEPAALLALHAQFPRATLLLNRRNSSVRR